MSAKHDSHAVVKQDAHGHEIHGHDAHGHDDHAHVEKFWLESWWPACVIGVGVVLVVCIDIFNRT